MIEVTGIDRDGESRFLEAEAASAASLASVILDSGWKYARLTCCGEVVAEVTLCSCDGKAPVRQVVTPEH